MQDFPYYWLFRANERPFKMFYRALLPRGWRNKINLYASHRQQEYTAKAWDVFLADYFAGKYPHFPMTAKQPHLAGEKIIWLYWGQGWDEQNLPEIVQICRKSVGRYAADYRVIELDDTNLTEYLDFPDFVWDKKQHNKAFKPAFFADILRLALLECYGGVWLDATVYLTAPLPEKYAAMDYFMFYRSQNAENQSDWEKLNADCFSWRPNHPVNVQNNIIFAKCRNRVIGTCLDVMLNFWATQNRIPHYFFFQIMYDRLMADYLADMRCPVEDDTLPHLLLLNFNRPFNPSLFESILQKSSLHKLDRRLKIHAGTFGEHLNRL